MAIDWNKIISAEVLSTSAVLIFSVGVAYTTLATGKNRQTHKSLNCKPNKRRCKTQ
jgi:hypothetical protein